MFWSVVQTVANFADSGGSVFGSGMYFSTVHVLQLRCDCLSIAQIQHFLRKICCSEVAIFFLFLFFCCALHIISKPWKMLTLIFFTHHRDKLLIMENSRSWSTAAWMQFPMEMLSLWINNCWHILCITAMFPYVIYYLGMLWNTHTGISAAIYFSQDKTDSKTQFLAPNVSIRLKNRVISCQNMRFAFIPSQISFKHCSAQWLKAKMIQGSVHCITNCGKLSFYILNQHEMWHATINDA